jgi:hypothetical protein
MSSTFKFLLGLALAWLLAWEIAGYFTARAAREEIALAEYVATPATRLEPGADVRVEGTLVDGPSTSSPFGRQTCLAAVTDVGVWVRYDDIHERPQIDARHVATRRVGPTTLEIAVGERRIELPLDRWSPRHLASQDVTELPASLGVTTEEIERARQQLRSGYSSGLSVSETTIQGGTPVFVAGRLEAEGDALRLAPDPVIDRIVLHPGSQADFADGLRGSGGGLRIAAWIFALGVGPLPLVILGVVLAARRRRG